MIDWWGLFSNAVWIFALAMLLATFSYQRYRTHQAPAASTASHVDALYRLGTLLFVTGQFLISRSRIEQAVWSILAIVLIAEPLMLHLRDRRQPATNTQHREDEHRG